MAVIQSLDNKIKYDVSSSPTPVVVGKLFLISDTSNPSHKSCRWYLECIEKYNSMVFIVSCYHIDAPIGRPPPEVDPNGQTEFGLTASRR